MKRIVFLTLLPAALAAQNIDPTTGAKIISIKEAVEMAHQHSPQVISAQGSIETAEGSVRTSKAAFYPQLGVSVGQSKGGGQSRDPVTGKILAFEARPWGYSNGVSISLPPVFDGGRTKSNLQAARTAVEQAEANEVTARFSVSLQVKQQYNAILSAREQETAARKTLAQANQQMLVARARVIAGASIISDSLQTLVAVGNAELAILQAQNSLLNANAQLTRLTGSPVPVTANPADTAQISLVPIDSALVMRLALEGPQIMAQNAAIATSEARLRAARAPYYPTVSASVGFSGAANDGWGCYGVCKQYRYSYSYGLSASYQIFDRFARSEAKRSSEIALNNAEATLKDQRLTIQANIINYLGLTRVADRQIRVGEAQLRAAEEALRVQEARYTLGQSTLVELLPAQTAVNSARSAIISARLAYRNAKAQIESIIGRDLQ
jgi:outer membrane protein